MVIRKRAIAMLVSGGLLVASLTACGGGWRHKSPEKRMAHMVEYVTDELSLTAPQVEKLDAVKKQVLSSRERFKRDSTIEVVSQSIASEVMDRDGLKTLAADKTRILNEEAPQLIDALGDFYDSLDAEQQAQVRKKLEKVKKRFDK